jgi:hypothetical protein
MACASRPWRQRNEPRPNLRLCDSRPRAQPRLGCALQAVAALGQTKLAFKIARVIAFYMCYNTIHPRISLQPSWKEFHEEFKWRAPDAHHSGEAARRLALQWSKCFKESWHVFDNCRRRPRLSDDEFGKIAAQPTRQHMVRSPLPRRKGAAQLAHVFLLSGPPYGAIIA